MPPFEARTAYRCSNCSRLAFGKPEIVSVEQQTVTQTMGGWQVLEGDDKPTALCPICITVAEATQKGVVLTNPDGTVVR